MHERFSFLPLQQGREDLTSGRIAHVRQRGKGDPGWGQTQRWGMAGASRSTSIYDQNCDSVDDNMNARIRGGIITNHDSLPLSAPTMTRQPRVSAQFESLPNAQFFQGYFMTGWSGMLIGFVPNVTRTPLAKNFNPNMQGAAELHPATTYDPFPNPGSLYPKAV